MSVRVQAVQSPLPRQKKYQTLEEEATSRPVGRGTGLGYTLGMGAAKAVRPLSLEEYLALEREAPTP